MFQAYTEAINLLHYSAVVLPVTKADKQIDKVDPNYSPLNEVDGLNMNACKKDLLWIEQVWYSQHSDDPDVYDGAPVGIQIVARKLEEEKVWAIGKIVSQILMTAGIK